MRLFSTRRCTRNRRSSPLEYALSRVWESWGIVPAAVLGHSIGELVAACVAGALKLDDALPLVALRGRLMQESSAEGSMMAVALGEQEALAFLAEGSEAVELAAINSPRQVVLTGHRDDLDHLRERLEDRGVAASRLKVRRAFHSALLDPVLPGSRTPCARWRRRDPRFPSSPTSPAGK